VLRITDAGGKSWSVYYRWEGKNTRLTLGPWPGIGVQRARQDAEKIRTWSTAGIDPKLARRAEALVEKEQIEEINRSLRTFEDLAEAYIKRETPGLAQGKAYARTIRRELLPAWKNIPVTDLRRRHLTRVTDKLLDRQVPAIASRTHEIAKRIFSWALDRGDVDAIPFAGMKPPVKKEPRQRALTDQEIAALWDAWNDMGYAHGDIQKLLLITGQRRTEVGEMRWFEVDLETAEWIIPAARSKSRRDHLVPLSSLALEVLRGIPQVEDVDFVFVGRGSKRAVTGYGPPKTRADELSGVTDWRLHDLRRTCRTGLAALGVPEIVAERCLNHAKKGMTAVYDVHEYEDEKRDALDAWAARLSKITSPPSVVALDTGAA
jgi:integrase